MGGSGIVIQQRGSDAQRCGRALLVSFSFFFFCFFFFFFEGWVSYTRLSAQTNATIPPHTSPLLRMWHSICSFLCFFPLRCRELRSLVGSGFGLCACVCVCHSGVRGCCDARLARDGFWFFFPFPETYVSMPAAVLPRASRITFQVLWLLSFATVKRKGGFMS